MKSLHSWSKHTCNLFLSPNQHQHWAVPKEVNADSYVLPLQLIPSLLLKPHLKTSFEVLILIICVYMRLPRTVRLIGGSTQSSTCPNVPGCTFLVTHAGIIPSLHNHLYLEPQRINTRGFPHANRVLCHRAVFLNRVRKNTLPWYLAL